MSGKHRIMVSNSIHDGQMLVYRRWQASHSKYAFSEALICFPYRIEHDDKKLVMSHLHQIGVKFKVILRKSNRIIRDFLHFF